MVKLQTPRPFMIEWRQVDGKPSLRLELLCCGLKAAAVDAVMQACVLELPDLNCTDMSGAIALSKCLLPEVRIVYTCNERGLDVVYKKSNYSDEKWSSGDLSRAGPANVRVLCPDAKPVTLEQIVAILVKRGDHRLIDKPPTEGG